MFLTFDILRDCIISHKSRQADSHDNTSSEHVIFSGVIVHTCLLFNSMLMYLETSNVV